MIHLSDCIGSVHRLRKNHISRSLAMTLTTYWNRNRERKVYVGHFFWSRKLYVNNALGSENQDFLSLQNLESLIIISIRKNSTNSEAKSLFSSLRWKLFSQASSSCWGFFFLFLWFYLKPIVCWDETQKNHQDQTILKLFIFATQSVCVQLLNRNDCDTRQISSFRFIFR